MGVAAVGTELRAGRSAGDVLQILTCLDRGEPADHTLTCGLELAHLGWRVTVVYGRTRRPSPMLERVRLQGTVGLIELPELLPYPEPICDIRAYCALRRMMLCHDFDVVHTHLCKAGLIGRLAARGLRCRVVHTPHHPLDGRFGRAVTALLTSLERRAARWCDRIIVAGREGRESHLARGIGHRDQFVPIAGATPERAADRVDALYRTLLAATHGDAFRSPT